MATRLTVVVPVYNATAFLRETLESLLAQTRSDFRFVVLDNVSTDGSPELARAVCGDRVEIVRATEHVPMTANWNRAVGLVETEYFVLAHADDVYEPEYVETMLPLLDRYPSAGLAHCRVRNIDEKGRDVFVPRDLFKERFWPDDEPYERGSCAELAWLRRGNYISPPSPVYRTSAVRSAGSYEERYLFVPDWSYWMKLVLAGFTVVGTRRRLVRYRKHGASLTKVHLASKRGFAEEIELQEWLATAGHSAGCFPDPQPDYSYVENTLSSVFADVLAAGDRESAAALLEFGERSIPGFKIGARHMALRLALVAGRPGGRTLGWMRDAYLACVRPSSWVW